MTQEELQRLVADVQQHQNELSSLEVKTARGGTPQRLYESLSAFANHTGGGVLLFGLDEAHNFAVAGVGQVQKLQADVSGLAREMEPALNPEFTLGEIDGEAVVAVEIDEVPAAQKPCYYKPAGLQKGSYIRVANTNRPMTDYEIFGYVSARSQPAFDEEPIRDATLDDLDPAKLGAYLDWLGQRRPQADYLRGPREEALHRLRLVRAVEGVPRPTLGGLLVFGKYPQEFESQLVITYLQFHGTTDTEKTPRGERFLDNRKFEGPLPALVTTAVDYVMAALRKSSLIEGVFRRDIPEYPYEAVREAIVNAVAHRDYSGFARGSYVQVRLFADRLEVQSPGGLYGPVTEENLEEQHSTRNRLLLRLLEDLDVVENRGSGIATMLEAMRQANLEPPRFQDKRHYFWVTFRNYTLMNPAAIAWLNQFAERPLNDRQRLALVYLRHNERITNPDYQRLNRVDSVIARQELRGLVQTGLVEQQSVKRWTYYTLKVSAQVEGPPAESNKDKVLRYVREHGSINNTECRQLLQLSVQKASALLKGMRDHGLLRQTAKRRWARYQLP